MQSNEKLYVRTAEGTNTLCRTTASGEITQMWTVVKLRGDRGEYYPRKVKDMDTDQYVFRKVITAQGYARLNNWIGLTFASPPELQVGEKFVGNPYFEREGASVKRVVVRRIGVARNAAGSLSATDLTLTYDLDDYLIGELWERWQPFKITDRPKPWGRIIGDPARASVKESEKVIACPGGIYLLVDLASVEVIKLWSQHLQRQKFAERNAVSICERNILKRYVGASYCSDDGSIGISHWSQPDRSIKQIETIARGIQEGKLVSDVDGSKIAIESVSESLDAKEAEEALAGEGEDAPYIEPSDDEEPAKETPAKIKEDIRKKWRGATQEQRDKALRIAGFNQATEASKCNDTERLNKFRLALSVQVDGLAS